MGLRHGSSTDFSIELLQRAREHLLRLSCVQGRPRASRFPHNRCENRSANTSLVEAWIDRLCNSGEKSAQRRKELYTEIDVTYTESD